MVIRVKHSGFLPRQGWQLCRVIGGSFAVKWVAAFGCNGWQLCRVIGGSFAVKWVAAFGCNGWQLCRVIGGSFAVKWVAAFGCNGRQLCREIRRLACFLYLIADIANKIHCLYCGTYIVCHCDCHCLFYSTG